MTDYVSFFVRYIPFWATPICFLGLEFGYVYWLKSRKKVYRFCFILAFFCTLLNLFYFMIGGPERAVEFWQTQIVYEYFIKE